MRAKFQYVNHSIAKDSKSRISLALLINCFSFVFIFTQTIPTLTIHDRKFECPITHLGIKFFQHLKSEVMYFIRGHSVCCEVRHDLLIRLLSVQQFPCWKRLVCRSWLDSGIVDIYEGKRKCSQTAGHNTGDAMLYVICSKIPKHRVRGKKCLSVCSDLRRLEQSSMHFSDTCHFHVHVHPIYEIETWLHYKTQKLEWRKRSGCYESRHLHSVTSLSTRSLKQVKVLSIWEEKFKSKISSGQK